MGDLALAIRQPGLAGRARHISAFSARANEVKMGSCQPRRTTTAGSQKSGSSFSPPRDALGEKSGDLAAFSFHAPVPTVKAIG